MPKLTYADTGESFEVPAGTNLLEFCQENTVPQDFGCTVGSCGTCRVVVVSGAENLNPAGDEELETVEMCTDEAGVRLGCQLVIGGDVTLKAAE
jgi:ferredoxin